jgi:hypothetical protein
MAISTDRRTPRALRPVIRRAAVTCVVVSGSLWFTTGSSAAVVSPVLQAETTSTTASDDAEASGAAATEVNPLLVPGPGADTPPQAPEPDADDATTEATVSEAVDPVGGSSNDDAEDTVRKVMFGLIAVAVALAALTVYYWWRTRPPHRVADSGRRAVTADDPPVEPRDGDGELSDAAQPDSDDPGTVSAWQTDSTSTR